MIKAEDLRIGDDINIEPIPLTPKNPRKERVEAR